MENALPTLIIGALLLIARAVLTHANVQSHDQLSQSFREMEARLAYRAQSELDIVGASLDGDLNTLTLSLFNAGQTRLATYQMMDVIVVYETAMGRSTKWLPFSDGALVPDSWDVQVIRDDQFEPGLLNPGETAELVVELSEPATAGQEKLVDLGQKIWRGGLPDRKVPACASCHSANGAGIPSQYPRLSGQFPMYIEEQLKLFRSGDRKNDVMFAIADRMSDADIKAVSDYAAGLR